MQLSLPLRGEGDHGVVEGCDRNDKKSYRYDISTARIAPLRLLRIQLPYQGEPFFASKQSLYKQSPDNRQGFVSCISFL